MTSAVRTGLCLVLILGLLGCTSITSSPTSSPSVPSLDEPSLVPSAAASVQPSIGLESLSPTPPVETSGPPKTPKPPKSARPSQSASAPGPNLVVTKFVTDDDRFVVDIHSEVRVTVKNAGNEDAGPFKVGISFTDGVGGGGTAPTQVDGLPAGDSIQVSIIISPLAAGNLIYTATADSAGEVAESNENDNSKDLSVQVIDNVNLAFVPGMVLVDRQDDGTYQLSAQVKNTGSSDLNDRFQIGITWQYSGGSGTFPTLSCCSHRPPMISAGGSIGLGEQVSFPASGGYVVTLLLDPNDDITESSDSDNADFETVTVP